MTKRGFISNGAFGLVSAIVGDDAAHALEIGARVITTRVLELDVGLQIGFGEAGTVDFVCPDTGQVEIFLDKVHMGLHLWDNHLMLMPFDTDDILSGLLFIQGAIGPLIDLATG